MDTLLENAARIFEIGCSQGALTEDGPPQDFALLIRPDGGLHFVMESEFSLEGAAIEAGALAAYRVTRSRDGVRVQGRMIDGRGGIAECRLEQHSAKRAIL